MSLTEPTLQGIERFQIIRRLGEGGMGVVYEAFDKEKLSPVALKTLKRLSPQNLLLFKNEFRSLANLHHPNLIQLYELFSTEELWFFSMELLPGQDLLSFICEQSHSADTIPMTGGFSPLAQTRAAPLSSEQTAVDFSVSSLFEQEQTPPKKNASPNKGFDEARLRVAIEQLTHGISALHAAGKIHRDIKPSNVMVTSPSPLLISGGEVRIVLMDFGLVREAISTQDARPLVVGTPSYMSPEQAAGQSIGVESDWYALGTILYQALTGHLPFTGSLREILIGKQERDAASPRSLCAKIPEDLERLCVDLLARAPERRPRADEILRRLGLQRSASAEVAAVLPSSPFVGREAELAKLKALFNESQKKRASVCVCVHGESGLGKTALIQKLFESLPQDVLVLSGRCYEQESVPYKALDSVIDALSRHLAKLDPEEVAQLLPREAPLLGSVFPVLRQFRASGTLEASLLEVQDPFERRSRVFAALRELFSKLSLRAPLVIFIDDLQWTDNDSLLLLSEILRPEAALFLVASVRGRGLEDPSLSWLFARLQNVSVQHIRLAGLSPLEVSTLVRLLHSGVTEGEAHWEKETGGHPLFIQEMARHARPQGNNAAPTKLDDVLLARINQLEPEQRHLLELSAVSGAALPQWLLAKAADLSVAAFYQKVLSLRVAQLVRTGGRGEQDPIEPYHDRVRESVVAHLDEATRRAHHRKLAETLEEASYQDPQALMRHWENASEPGRAASYAIQAAELARSAMAFERASDLYRAALRLGQYPKTEERRLYSLLGESLSYSGRGREAADALLTASEGAPKAERLKGQLQAMRQLLSSGYIEDGLKITRALLHEVGGYWTTRNATTLSALLWHRAALRMRGLHWSPQEEKSVSPEKRLALDVYEQISTCLGPVDTVRGALYQACSLRLSLEIGEPRQIVRGLTREAIFLAVEGVHNYPRARGITETVSRQAEASGDPEMLAWASFGSGTVSVLAGRFQEALRLCTDAEQRFREHVPGSHAELNTAVLMRLMSMRFVGNYREMAPLVPGYLLDAARRDDRFTETTIPRAFNSIWLVDDDVAEARRQLTRTTWSPLKGSYHLQQWDELCAKSWIALYDGSRLSPELEAGFKDFSRSLLARCELVRTAGAFLYGCLLLAEAQRRWVKHLLLRQVKQIIQELYRIPADYTRSMGLLLEAGVAKITNPERAPYLFQLAELSAEQSGLRAEVAVARLRRGEMIGGQEGAALLAVANEFMTQEGIKNPARFARIFSP